VLQSGFQDVEVLGVVPLPPLPDQDLPAAKKQLESFRSEAGVILAEANAADDLAAPLAVAAAEAENLTLNQLGKKKNKKDDPCLTLPGNGMCAVLCTLFCAA